MKIAIGFDGSDSARVAAARAVELFTPCEPEYVLVRAFARPVRSGLSAREATDTQLRDEAAAELRDLRDQLQTGGGEIRTRLEVGPPRRVLEQFVDDENPEVFVVGARGRGEMKKMLLGSVSSFAVNHLSCPVLVIREDGGSIRTGRAR